MGMRIEPRSLKKLKRFGGERYATGTLRCECGGAAGAGFRVIAANKLSDEFKSHTPLLLWDLHGFQLRAELSIVGQYYHLQDDQLNLKLSVTSSACFG
ncbi:hypothetical protein SDJN03_27052, partial [Cucurbita argyrosperma subsp. sororia]